MGAFLVSVMAMSRVLGLVEGCAVAVEFLEGARQSSANQREVLWLYSKAICGPLLHVSLATTPFTHNVVAKYSECYSRNKQTLMLQLSYDR